MQRDWARTARGVALTLLAAFAARVPAAGPGPFLVQVGAFAESGNRYAMEARVRGLGFDVVTETGSGTGGRPLARVAAGSFADRAQARAAARRLRAAGLAPFTRKRSEHTGPGSARRVHLADGNAGNADRAAGADQRTSPVGPMSQTRYGASDGADPPAGSAGDAGNGGVAGKQTSPMSQTRSGASRGPPPPPAARFDLSGSVGVEVRGFPRAARFRGQRGDNLSLVIEPELYYEWDDGRKSVTFVPFARLDQQDPERTHVDLRELLWQRASDAWELRAGVGKVFWGVAESQHLVDIINQTDLVEDPDGEDKLGQPMLDLALIRDWGTLDLFVLPGFRERTFPGRKGRLRSEPRVDTDRPRFESSRRGWHVDLAARWFRTFGDWDVGLSHFYGTSREPRLLLARDGAGKPVLVPRYDLIHQTGVDVQATKGDWLWKVEAIRRSGQGETFLASTVGFEYTRVGVFGTSADLGVLAEYLYDDRGRRAPTPFEDDLFAGLRLTLNDAPSTAVLAGIIFDRDSDAKIFNLEASRRLGDAWKLYLISRAWSGVPATDPLFSLRDDDYVQLELARFF